MLVHPSPYLKSWIASGIFIAASDLESFGALVYVCNTLKGDIMFCSIIYLNYCHLQGLPLVHRRFVNHPCRTLPVDPLVHPCIEKRASHLLVLASRWPILYQRLTSRNIHWGKNEKNQYLCSERIIAKPLYYFLYYCKVMEWYGKEISSLVLPKVYILVLFLVRDGILFRRRLWFEAGGCRRCRCRCCRPHF